jgi:hypothetical protein
MAENEFTGGFTYTPPDEKPEFTGALQEPPSTQDPGLSGFEARVREYSPEARKEISESPIKGRLPSWESVPLLGPALQKSVALGSAAAGYGQGETIGERYQSILAYDEARRRAQQEFYPYSSIAGNVAGGVASLPLMPGGSAAQTFGTKIGEKGSELLSKAVAPVSSYLSRKAAEAAPAIGATTGKAAEGALIGTLSSLAESKYGAGETLGETAERTATGAAFGAAAPVVVGGLFKGFGKTSDVVEGIISPKTAVARQIVEGSGPQKINEYIALMARNEPVNIADIQQAKNLLRAAVARFGENDPRVINLNDALKQRYQNQTIYINNQVDSAFGTKIDPFQIRMQSDQLARAQNKPAYDLAFAQPQGQSIWNRDVAQFVNTAEGKYAVQVADNMARHEAYQTGKAAPRNPFVQDANGNLILAPNETGASLEFLNYVKRAMNGIASDIRAGKVPSSNPSSDARMIEQSTRKFTDDLGMLVPEYKAALSGAGKYIRGNNALEAGQEFADLLSTGGKGSMSDVSRQLYNFQNKFRGSEPESFRQGIGVWIKENPQQAARLFAGDYPDASRVQGILKTVLTPARYNKIDAGMSVGRLAELTKEIHASPSLLKSLGLPSISGAGPVGYGLAGYALGQEGTQIVQKMFQLASQNLPSATAGAVGMAGGVALNASNARKLGAILDLATNNTPKNRKILLNAAYGKSYYKQKIDELNRLLSRTLSAQQELIPDILPGTGPAKYEERRFPRATGGRINHSSVADQLITAAEKSKRNINKTTEPLLKETDNNVAHALEIANRSI